MGKGGIFQNFSARGGGYFKIPYHPLSALPGHNQGSSTYGDQVVFWFISTVDSCAWKGVQFIIYIYEFSKL